MCVFVRVSQECLFYTGDIAEDQYYCSAVCDPSPCDDGEECSLTAVGCSAGSICGNGYVCFPGDSDDGAEQLGAIVEDCSACGEFQVRGCVCVGLVWTPTLSIFGIDVGPSACARYIAR